MLNEETINSYLISYKNGNKSALEKLLQEFEKSIYRICFRFFNNEDEALDATQETLIKIVRFIDNFKGMSSFSTWVYRIATNTCLTIADKKKKEKESIMEVIKNWWNNLYSVTPEEIVLKENEVVLNKELIYKSLYELKDTYKIPIILKDIEGFKLEKISEILELPVGTIKSRINRGRIMLQERFLSHMKELDDEKM